jgi:hypothetical protein
MDCNNVRPIYFKGGLAITEYINPGVWDEVRAFVVMEFPYRDNIVKQAFYRSSGHNSAETFGPGFTTETARGTWLPFNAIVVKTDNRASPEDDGSSLSKSVKTNVMLILKYPFVEYIPGILNRFHDDPELAYISYLMGGGIWETKLGKKFIMQTGLNEQKLLPGCVGLKDKLVRATAAEVNKYIGNAVSWNWHPKDIINGSSIEVDLRDPGLWTTSKSKEGNRVFISEHIFGNHVKNYVKIHPLIKQNVPIPNLSNLHQPYPWADDIELYNHDSGLSFGKRIRRTSKRRTSRKRRTSKRRTSKRRTSKRRSKRRL